MDLNQAVITTKYVTELKSKVVFVHHSSEGWQFFGAEKNIKESDSRVVSLEKILLLNPHIRDIIWIEEGMEAWVDEKNTWKTGLSNYE